MKISPGKSNIQSSSNSPRNGGFTLVELMISMTILSLLIGGIVYANVYGLKMCEMTKKKLERSHDARAAVGQIANEVRSAKMAAIGEVNAGTFMAKLQGEKQMGNALIVYPTTNTNSYVVYFLNTADKTFRRYTSVTKTPVALAGMVTNTAVFRMQNYSGNVLTNAQNSWVINMKLEFFQPREFSEAEYYKLETAMTRRVTGI